MKQPVNIGGWDYPPGVCVVANAYLVHHDPEIYPDPVRLPPGAVPRGATRHVHVDPVRGRAPPLPRRQLRAVEMKIVLQAVLSRCEVRPGTDGVEVSRRRAITVSPNRQATTVLHDRPAVQGNGRVTTRVPEPAATT